MGILDFVKSPEQIRAEKDEMRAELERFSRERIALLAKKHFDEIVKAVQREYMQNGTIERMGKQIVRTEVWLTPSDCMECIFPNFHKAEYSMIGRAMSLLTDGAEKPKIATENYSILPDDHPVSYTCTYHLLTFSDAAFTAKPGRSRVDYDYAVSEIGRYYIEQLRRYLDADEAFTYRFSIGIEDGASDEERRREKERYPLAGHFTKPLLMAQAATRFDYLRRPYITPYFVARVAYEKK